MSFVIAAVSIGAVAASPIYGVYSGERTASQQKRAANDARAAALKQADQADQANNAANKKKPNVGALMAGNQAAGGAGSTMLTGPGGIDLSALTLGKNTLLGQ